MSPFKTKSVMLNETSISKICRSCLLHTDKMIQIFSNNKLAQWLLICAGIEVSQDDELPALLCGKCLSQLRSAYTFKKKCQKSDKILKRWKKTQIILEYNDQNEDYLADVTTQYSRDSNELDECGDNINTKDDSNKCLYNEGFDKICTSPDFIANTSDDDDLPLIHVTDQRPNDKAVTQITTQVILKNNKKELKKSKRKISLSLLNEGKNYLSHNEDDRCNNLKRGRTDILSCGICCENFLSKELLTLHKQIHFYYYCRKCKARCKNLGEYRVHECTGNRNKKLNISIKDDPKISSVPGVSIYEIDRNSFDRIFWCHLCEKELTCSRSLKYHLRSHSGEKPHLCTMCGKLFREHRALVNHIRAVHTGEKRFKCSFCPKGEKPHLCTMCGKLFREHRALVNHIRAVHTGEKRFKSFSVSGKKRQHERIHTGEKPYQCDLCCRLFAARSTLNAHVRRHTQENKFPCKVEGCDRGFYSFSTYQRHMWAHRGERPYQCTRCAKTYLSKQNLKSHFKSIHSQVRDEICHICNKEFTEKSTLNRHVRTIHKSEPKMNNKPVPVYGFPVDDVKLGTTTKHPRSSSL